MDPNLKKTCQELLELIDYLQLPGWPLEEITREEAKVRIANFFGLDLKDPQLLEKALEKINQILAGELKIESVPRNLDELVREHEEHQEELAKQREAFLKRTYPTLSEQIRNALQTKHAHDLLLQLKESEKQLPEKEKILTQNPKRAERAGEQIAGLLAQNLPQTARVEALTEEDYQEVLKKAQPEIKQILERVGVTQPEKTIQIFIDQAVKKDLPLAQEVAATPRSFTKEVPPPRKKISPEDLVLPKKVADRLAEEPESVAFALVYTALQPQAAVALAQKKVIFAPMVMVFRAASEPTPEWQEMIEKGIFVEDIEATIKRYKEAGLLEDHPIIQSLEDKKARFLEKQKTKIVRDGKVIYRDKLAARILRRYYLYTKQIGGLEPIDKETGFPLQSSPAPLWSKREGYSWQLRQFLDATGSATRLYETVDVIPGRKVIRFTLPSKIVRKITFGRFESFGAIRTTVYQKTVGRAVSYVGRKLAETAIGKAVKEGFKKAATWVATKLGVEAGIVAAGTAVAPGVGTAIGLVVSAAIEIGGKILGKVWDAIKTIIRDPEKSLVALIGGITFAAFFSSSIPLVIIGVGASVIGGLGAISWGATSAGAVASGLAANVVAFFTAVATLPITAPIALFIVGIISTIATITFFIVMTTAGAFILPIAPAPTISAYLKVTKNVNRNEIPNDELPNSPCVTYTVNVSAQQPIIITSVTDERTVVCIGSTPKVETPVNISHPTDPITSWTSGSYELCFDSSFADCRVCNTVTVVANVVDGPTGQMGSDTTCVDIGSPPEDCPQGWPTEHGYITQGPNANYSHPGQEAIDIGVPIGTPVKSTHEGDVVEATWGTSVVKVRGTCNSKMFVTDYIHLQNKAVRTGDHIYRGDLIGTSGTGGTGSHLHYEFVGLEMASPYIPIRDDILEGCCLRVPLCSKNCYDLDIYTKW